MVAFAVPAEVAFDYLTDPRGEWRGLRVRVGLTFRTTPDGCRVEVTCPWLARPIAIRDLRHAARLLSRR